MDWRERGRWVGEKFRDGGRYELEREGQREGEMGEIEPEKEEDMG